MSRRVRGQWFFVALAVCLLPLRARGDTIDQPAGPLAAALLTLAQQQSVQIVFRSDIVGARHTEGARGASDIQQALRQMLAHTGLHFRFLPPSTYLIEPDEAPPRPAVIEEVRVTGSYIRQRDPLLSTESVFSIERGEWQAAATPATTRLLQGLTQAAGSDGWVDNLLQPFVTGTADLNLRNLGIGSALILVNGRRQAAASVVTVEGATFVDLNMLPPLEALARVEILMDGASATYGSDAVAGVVNLVPRRDLEGAEWSVDYNARPGSEYRAARASWLQGSRAGDVQWLSALVLSDATALPARERAFTRGTAWSNGGNPGTFLTGAGWVRDPACGVSGSRVAAGAPFCQLDISTYYDVSPEEQRQQWFGSLETAAGDWAIGAEGALSHARIAVSSSPSYPFATALPVVPVDNPGNSFGEPVRFYGRVLGAGANAEYSAARYVYGSGSLQAQRDWRAQHLSIVASASEHRADYSRRDALIDKVQQALDGHGGAQGNQFWNPRYGADNPPGLIDSFFADWNLRGRSTLATLDAVLDSDWTGTRFGEFAYAFGAQARRERFAQNFAAAYNEGRFLSLGGGRDFAGTQQVRAVFGETRWDWQQRLGAQISLRNERYSGGQTDTTPKLGLRWTPYSKFALRANISKAFRAASVFQTVGYHAVPEALTDPTGIDQTPAYHIVQTQGNRALKPETATVTTIGASWMDDTAEWQLNAWHYDYRDLILKESPQGLINHAAQGDAAAQAQLQRDPDTGELIVVHTRFVNAADVRTQGVDARFAVDLPAPWPGRWRLSGEATRVTRFDLREAAGAPWQSALAMRNTTNALARPLPRERAALRLDWTRDRHSVQIGANYIGPYRDDGNDNQWIGAFIVWDTNYRLRIPLAQGALEWRVGAHNIFDRDPPRVGGFLGYDSKLHDPRGRLLETALRWQY